VLRKAVIPVAGRGTRLRPVTAVVPKAMFPLADGRGRIRAVGHLILAEAARAGVESAALVVSPEHLEMIRRYFDALDRQDLPRIEYVVQPEPGGFGQAVLCAANFVAGEPFLLLLGDHVHAEEPTCPPCAAQVAGAFAERRSAAMVGMQPVGPEELPRVGIARGEPVAGPVYRCVDFVEKPDLATARRRLVTPGLEPDRFLAHAGIYAFAPDILDCLAELSAADRPTGREIQLADAQSLLLRRRSEDYYLLRLAGRAYDTGDVEGYLRAMAAMGAAPPARP